MGYYTKYEIEIVVDRDFPSCEHQFDSKFCPECGIEATVIKGQDYVKKELIKFLVDERQYGNPFQEENKWYDHEQHMREFSIRFPDVLFRLRGFGEEHDDMWIKYFKDGKCQEAKANIEFRPFDETELK